jgi:hypothetical protein
MLSRIYLFAGVLCVSSYALAASPSIGTLTARGETKIDNYEVRGSGTLFEGSVVETGQSISSSADLRLANSEEITLWRDSRGTLYRDHFLLQRGKVQLGLADSFSVQANGVVVVSAEAHSSGFVSIDPANSVTIETKDGTLEIRDSSGASIARVRPGHPLQFSSLTDKSSGELSATGTVSSENGRYYLDSSETCMKYEVKGASIQNYVGTSVVASGVLDSASPAAGTVGLLQISSIQASNAHTPLEQPIQFRERIGGFSIMSGVTSQTTRKCPPQPLEDCCPGVPSPQCCNPLPPNECGHSN